MATHKHTCTYSYTYKGKYPDESTNINILYLYANTAHTHFSIVLKHTKTHENGDIWRLTFNQNFPCKLLNLDFLPQLPLLSLKV